MKTLKRSLGLLKRKLGRMVEIKAGILLHQPVAAREGAGIPGAELARASVYRPDLDYSKDEFTRRNLRQNDLYELLVDQRPVCFGWVARAGARVGILHDIQMTVPDRAFYIWDCVTPPEYRGRGYFQSLLKQLVSSRDTGANLALVAVDTRNTASRKALAKAGFQPLFSYLSIRVLGRVVLAVANRGHRLSQAQILFDQLA